MSDQQYRLMMTDIEQLRARVVELERQVKVGDDLTGSFFEALKPLKLESIDVANPGRHVTNLIDQLTAVTARVAELEGAMIQQAANSAQAVKDYAQQLATVTAERNCFQSLQLEVAKALGYGEGAQLSLQSYILRQLAARTYTWTTARPTVAGWYLYRDDASDDDPMIIDIQEVSFVSGQGHWAGPIMGPEEAKQ